jgi:hypothetical protein
MYKYVYASGYRPQIRSESYVRRKEYIYDILVEGNGDVKTDKKTVTCKLKLVKCFALCGAMQRANSDPDMASLSPSQKKMSLSEQHYFSDNFRKQKNF